MALYEHDPRRFVRASVCDQAPPGRRTWLQTINGRPMSVRTEQGDLQGALTAAQGIHGAPLRLAAGATWEDVGDGQWFVWVEEDSQP